MKKKEFIKTLTVNLIKQKTLPDKKRELKDGFKMIQKAVEKKLLDQVEIKKFTRKDFESLLFKNKSRGPIKLLLVGHLDVVPANNSQFSPKIKNQFIIGRGALDMKGPLASMTFSFINLIQDNKQLPLGLLITSDEEVGGKNGVGCLVPKFKKCNVAIIPDANVNFDIVHLQKAPLHFKVTCHGDPAHASRPWEGKNAIEKLTFILEKVKKLSQNKRRGDTISVTQINGGEAINKIPQNAFAIVDARLTTQPEKSNLIRKVKKICQINNANFQPLDEGLLFSINKKNKFLKLWKKIAEKKLKKELKFVEECGASDARFFAAHGIPTIVTSPRGFGQHSTKEGVDLNSLCQLSDIIKEFVLKSERLLR